MNKFNICQSDQVWVHTALTMTDNGAAYMITLPSMAILPTMVDRSLVVWARVRTRDATAPTTTSSTTITSSTWSLFFRSQYRMKRSRYTSSMAIPAPLILVTSKLCGCTTGSPYTAQRPQLMKVPRYGAGEYCSTDPFLHIWTNVGLKILAQLKSSWLLHKFGKLLSKRFVRIETHY